MENIKLEQTEKELVIRITKEKNITLDDLKQKIINSLYKSDFYDENEVKLIEILFK